MVFNFIINVSKTEAATVQNVMVDKLEIPKCLCFILRSVKSSTLGNSCSPYLSLRRWDLQRARCPNTVCASGTLLCEYSFSWCDSTQITLSLLFNLNIHYQLDLKQPGAYVLFLCISRKSKGLSGRALRKLPFLAHALFVKVNIWYSSMENPWSFLFFNVALFVVVCRRQQWLLRGFWRLWIKQWINRWRKKLTWSMASELIAMSKGWHMIVHELTDPMPCLFIALENHNNNQLYSSVSSVGSTVSHILAGINKIMLSLT